MLQFFGFAIDFVMEILDRMLIDTKPVRDFFWKTNNGNQMHGLKLSTEVITH